MGKRIDRAVTKPETKPEIKNRKSSQINTIEIQTDNAPTPRRKLARKHNIEDTPLNGEPAAKRNRLENSTDRRRKTSVAEKETGEEENTRRRRTLKHGEVAPPQCSFCKEEQKSEDEELLACTTCKAYYHPGKCLRYKDELKTNIRKLKEWFCPRCVLCSSCERFISDPSNVECSVCCRAWHGTCAPKGHYPSIDFDSAWYCGACCRSRNFRIYDSPPPTPSRPGPKGRKSRAPPVEDSLRFDCDVDELTDLINRRDSTMDALNIENGLSKSATPSPLSSTQNNKQDEKPRMNGKTDNSCKKKNAKIPLVLKEDSDLYDGSRKVAYSSKPSSSVVPTGQLLHFGTGKVCKAIYASAYEEPLHSAPNLYSCKFCLHTTHLKENLVIHWDHCTAKHPPGNEIYRDDGLAFFEVDGAVQKKYCQDLCLISKLFIASKTLYAEVETFIFYVLCEITTEGYVIVGYFSKEKNPSKNNNLSCLLVLPMVQKMGYGRLLIDMSYELSRIELRVGHPEHPLSDLGILAYRGYWRSSLLCYLREHRKFDRVNIKDISLATRITPVDIVNQLMFDKLITLKGGVYTLKTGKRALKFPLSQCRRRFVDPKKIIWRARPTKEYLDPTKCNSYVSV
ncbi:hypothetical protein GCK72_000996 [Caenorhabditis remanei]|uniref:Histone acetyltransferase n=1 Tax=Caenorhabditis remanei TaxID=31234 RepID=A0A6A5HTT2_CAERE|nr:hypothetical protein GCK72_000996 [Caenorhabditis remanei]KAF1769182.1 hypothetical protein GCK72_000996 [Caenorhabditis remanei]